MSAFLEELKRTGRSLLRDRGIFLAAVVCLALGIGTQTVSLELLDAFLLRPPLGIEDASELHRLYLTSQTEGVEKTISAFPYPVVEALSNAGAFASLGGYFYSEVPVDAGAHKMKLPTSLVDAGYFDVLAVRLPLGRTFTPEEAGPGSFTPVALVTYAAAERLFGSAPRALGSSFRISNRPFEVIGVLPKGFSGVDLDRVDLFLPIGAATALGFSADWYTKTNSWFINALVRDGRSKIAVEDQATRILEDVLGGEYGIRFGAIQAVRKPNSPVAASLFVGLAAVAGLVLLIASMVVASLFVVRHLRRQGEFGVRMALGAKESDILGLVLRDALAVGLVAGVLAVFVAVIEGRLVRSFVLPENAAAPDPSLGRLALLTLVLVGLTTLFCGMLPALRLKGRDMTELLKAGRKLGGVGRFEEGLLILQVAFASLAFVAVGWFLASVAEIRAVDLGLDPEKVAVVTVDTEGEPPEVVRKLTQDLEARLRTLPRVEQVARAIGTPLRSSYGVSVTLPGSETPTLETGGPYVNGVSPRFFETLGTRILRGRSFTEVDERTGAERVVVLNETMARLFFPENDALERCIGLGDVPCVRIVGIAANARRTGLREEPTFQLYVPSTQAPEWMGPAKNLFVRVSTDSEERIIREAVASVAGDRVVEVKRLDAFLERDLRPFRIGTSLLTLFALLALLLVALGIYAALARQVAAQVQEIGVRMALGAGRSSIVSMIAWRALRFLIPGLALGILAALLVGRFAEPLLFEVSASDLRVLISAAVLLLALALVASIRPTVRACRISPSEALSVE